MEYLLSALIAMGMVSLCGAQCVTINCAQVQHEAHSRDVFVKNDCWMDEVHREKGEEWEKDCQKCICDGKHITCCSDVATPDIKDKENCEAVFNKEQCKYDIIPKGAVPCKVEGWMI